MRIPRVFFAPVLKPKTDLRAILSQRADGNVGAVEESLFSPRK
jgi:hypothetical protein